MLTCIKFVDVLQMKLFLLLIGYSLGGNDLYEGDNCRLKNGNFGICTKLPECISTFNALKKGTESFHNLSHCSFVGKVEVICCGDRDSGPITRSTTSTETPDQIVFINNDNEINPFNQYPRYNSTKDNFQPTPETRGGRKATTACEQYSAYASQSLSYHILDGIPTAPGEFPHMAAFGYPSISGREEWSWDCGGSLISDKYILTAAHCVTRNRLPSVIRLGTVSLNTNVEDMIPVDVEISEIISHPEYTPTRQYNDIAIIRLSKALNFTNYIRPACLYTSTVDINPSQKLIATGWGTVSLKTRAKSSVLLQTNLTAVSLSSCNQSHINYGEIRRYPNGLDQGQLCAFDPDLRRDACEGDSGGPLQIKSEQNTYTIVGITSFGIGCATEIPGVYARVAYYLEWIESIVW